MGVRWRRLGWSRPTHRHAGRCSRASATRRPPNGLTALLAASVTDGDDPRELAIGERDRLVLALRSQLSGDALDCVFPCPCGETLELELSVAALLDACASEHRPREAQAATSSGASVRVRAATGSDHELAARRAAVDTRGRSPRAHRALRVRGA